MGDLNRRLESLKIPLEDPPFSLLWPIAGNGVAEPEQVSFRRASDDHWASLRFVVPVPKHFPGAEIVVKQWVNDWWPVTCPDLPMRSRGSLRWVPACADTPGALGPTWWVAGLDHHGAQGVSGHLAGTNVELRLPDAMDATAEAVSQLLSRFTLVAPGPTSWYERAFHVRRDIPERGWGDGLVTRLDWSPWASAPEHPGCPAPDLLAPHALPDGWLVDATGARANPRLDHHERQWVVVREQTGDPLLWARAVPLASRHRVPLIIRLDGRYRLDWDETPVGWAGSLDPAHGHHVILLERGGLRIEVWVGLAAGLDRDRAALAANRAFP